MPSRTATLLITCPDQHMDRAAGLFLQRPERGRQGFDLSAAEFPAAFRPLAEAGIRPSPETL